MNDCLCEKCRSETCWNAGHDTYITSCSVFVSQKLKTNADRIRSMNDEELAEILHNAGGNWYSEEYWLNWLKQEVEEGK